MREAFVCLSLRVLRSCTAAHFTTLQHTATHCSIIQYTATHCNTLQHTATHCNTLQHCHRCERRLSVCLCVSSSTVLQHTLPHYNTLQLTVCVCLATTHCSTLQHSATLCNTLPRIATLSQSVRVFLCTLPHGIHRGTLHGIKDTHRQTVCCGVLQCVAACGHTLWYPTWPKRHS